MKKSLSKPLRIICENLKNTENEWCVVTSCALGLQGVDIAISDIDILTSKQGVTEISNRLSDFQTLAPTYNHVHENFQSYWSEFLIDGFQVEVFGDFHARSAATNQEWVCLDSQVRHAQIVMLGDLEIPVLPLRNLIEMYRIFNREKDLLKIKKIQQRDLQL